MPWTVEYIADKQMALVFVEGQISDEDLKQQVEATIQMLREHGASLVLVDCSQALSQATLPALYYLPDQATSSHAPWHLRLALVLPESGYRIDTFHFFELVFKSAGYDVRLFDRREQAEAWLLHAFAAKIEVAHVAHA